MHDKMISVISSSIVGVQYVGTTLLVEFKKGVYAYENVPRDIFDGMQIASSKGTYVNEVVKQGGFDYRLLSAAEVDALLARLPEAMPTNRLTVSMSDLVEKYPFLRNAF